MAVKRIRWISALAASIVLIAGVAGPAASQEIRKPDTSENPEAVVKPDADKADKGAAKEAAPKAPAAATSKASKEPCEVLGTKLGTEIKGDDIDVEATVNACRDAVAEFPDVARYERWYGMSLIFADDVEGALKWLDKAAGQGDLEAQSFLGFMYMTALRVPQDFKAALKYTKPAAEKGFAEAQDHLGFMHEKGYGVTADLDEAVKWYTLSAEQGHGPAQYRLAEVFRVSPLRDPKTAANWYRRAAIQGNARAQYRLARMYDEGEGVPKDEENAGRWYKRAADQGHRNARRTLSRSYPNLVDAPSFGDTITYVNEKFAAYAGMRTVDMKVSEDGRELRFSVGGHGISADLLKAPEATVVDLTRTETVIVLDPTNQANPFRVECETGECIALPNGQRKSTFAFPVHGVYEITVKDRDRLQDAFSFLLYLVRDPGPELFSGLPK